MLTISLWSYGKKNIRMVTQGHRTAMIPITVMITRFMSNNYNEEAQVSNTIMLINNQQNQNIFVTTSQSVEEPPIGDQLIFQLMMIDNIQKKPDNVAVHDQRWWLIIVSCVVNPPLWAQPWLASARVGSSQRWWSPMTVVPNEPCLGMIFQQHNGQQLSCLSSFQDWFCPFWGWHTGHGPCETLRKFRWSTPLKSIISQSTLSHFQRNRWQLPATHCVQLPPPNPALQTAAGAWGHQDDHQDFCGTTIRRSVNHLGVDRCG